MPRGRRQGAPPNRHGGPGQSIRGAAPADVLLRFLEANDEFPTSGYVEFTEPDGSMSYAVDGSGRGVGWTTLVNVAPDGGGWVLAGWTSSGC